MHDRRIDHFWDEENRSGEWLVANAGAPSDWDFYLLFGPDAEWKDRPGPLLGSGATVFGAREQLRQEIRPFLDISAGAWWLADAPPSATNLSVNRD